MANISVDATRHRVTVAGEPRNLADLSPDQQQQVQDGLRGYAIASVINAVAILSGGRVTGRDAEGLTVALVQAIEAQQDGRDALSIAQYLDEAAATAAALARIDARVKALGPGIRRLKAERDALARQLAHERGVNDELAAARRRRMGR